MSAVDASNGLVPIFLDLVALLPLIGLLYAGRASRHRRLVLIAGGAVVAALAWLVLGRLEDFARPGYPTGMDAVTFTLAMDVVITAGGILTIAAWVLLLYAALQARRNGWVVAMAVIVVLTLVAPQVLTSALLVPVFLGGALTPLLILGPIAALVCAWFLPTDPASDKVLAERPTV